MVGPRCVIIIVALFALAPFSMIWVSANHENFVIGPTSIKIDVVADSLVNNTNPDVNYGELTWLYVSSSAISYLMFELPDLPANATVANARLELYAFSGSASGSVDVYYCPDDSWTEGGITWNNKPSYNLERTDRISPRSWTGWENPWYVTADVRRGYSDGDMRLTLVIVYSGAWARYGSGESNNKPRLLIEYLTPPCYKVLTESIDETGRTSNVGYMAISGQDFALPSEVLVKPGIHPLDYEGDYEFVRWETEGSISVESASAEETVLTVLGAGRVRAVGRSAELMLGSVQDTGATSNIGYIVIDDEHYVLPKGIPLIKPGTYQISYEGGYKFLTWVTSGNVSITGPDESRTTITIRAGSGDVTAMGSAEIMEYAYDDGKVGTYEYQSEEPGEMWAVRFTPLFSGRLLRARFYIVVDPNAFAIHLLDEGRNHITDPIMRIPYTPGWFDVDLSNLDIQVKARKDFYIGIEWVEEYKPKIGRDNDIPRDERSWHWNGTRWDGYPSYYDVQIRAVVETAMLQSQITCASDIDTAAYLGEVEISGSISPSDPETASALVVLQYSSDGTFWFNITSVSCVSSSYSYSWSPTIHVGSYMIRAAWQGSDTYFGSSSQSQYLIIVKSHTTLTCAFDAETIETDKPAHISGSLSPAIDDAMITLTFTLPDGYQYNQTAWTSADGSFEFELRPTEEGVWEVKAHWPGDEDHFHSESAVSQLNAVSPFPFVTVGVVVAIVLIVAFIVIIKIRRPRSLPLPPPPPPR